MKVSKKSNIANQGQMGKLYVNGFYSCEQISSQCHDTNCFQCSSRIFLVHGGSIGKVQASLAKGPELKSRPTQTKDLHNEYLSLSNLVLGIYY